MEFANPINKLLFYKNDNNCTKELDKLLELGFEKEKKQQLSNIPRVKLNSQIIFLKLILITMKMKAILQMKELRV